MWMRALLAVLPMCVVCESRSGDNGGHLDLADVTEQTKAIARAHLACILLLESTPQPASRRATRQCMRDGTWYKRDSTNKTWSNYTDCVGQAFDDHLDHYLVDPIVHEHFGHWLRIYNIGYCFSLIFLMVAMIIMIGFRRLHCRRNTIHLNLFASFLLRSVAALVKDNLFVQGLGLPRDVTYTPSGLIVFRTDVTHWECKLMMTCFYYVWFTSYVWIFVEAVYLHALIFVSVFVEKAAIVWYVVFGWGAGLLFIAPWVIVRLQLEDELCWNTHRNEGYFWIIKAPVVLSIVVNFCLFVRIVVALFKKLRTTGRQYGSSVSYTRLARSTLVLIFLFGVHYIIVIFLPDHIVKLEVAKIYIELVFTSFQGFIVSILFCFLNSEVQTELGRLLCCDRRLRIDQSSTLASNVPQERSTGDVREMVVLVPPHAHTEYLTSSKLANGHGHG